jgi:WD40 repeat protein/tRNA A-37 threonylcarbamoyl transferase component Bud32
MISCPSSEQLMSLLEESIPVDEEMRLTKHLETCETCHVRWLDVTGEWRVDQEVTELSQTAPFLERLQQQVPAELLAATKEKKSSTIQFPGSPTAIGKLGQLEHFHIQREIGQGATGIVYLAWDEKLHRQVALKVLRPESLTSELARTRFEREARTASSVQNEHIIKVYDFRTLPNQLPYIVMDYVEGESLTQLLERDISIDPPLAAQIILQVAQGLSAAHRQGLVHRDVKPSNILIKSDQKTRIVITDFGLARTTAVQAHDPRGRLTFSGETIGTPEYMSPEQISHPDTLDQRSDLFSVGVVLFEMLTGKLPFQGASLPDTFRVIRFEEPHTPRQLNTKVPRDLETICMKCLEKDPQNRFQSAAVLAEELDRYLGGKPILSRPVGFIEHLWRWSLRNPRLAVAGGVAVAALLATMIIAIAFALYESRTSREFQLRAATLTFDKGLELCQKGDAGQGMLWFARSYEMAPPDAVDLRRLIQANLNSWYQQICPLQVFVEQEAAVLAVAFDKDGITFATGDRSGMVRRYETATGQPVGVPLLHKQAVLAVAFSPDGKKLLTGCADSSGRLWDVETGKVLHKLQHQQAVTAVSFGPADKNIMLTGSYDRTVKVWDVKTGKPVGKPLPAHDGAVHSLAISGDGKMLLTGTEDIETDKGKVFLWDIESWKQLTKPIQHPGAVRAVAFHPNGKSFATGSVVEALIWDVQNPTRPVGDPLRHGVPVRSVCYSADGRCVLTGSDDRTVRLWDAETGKQQGAFLRHADTVRGVAFHPKTSMVLTGSEDKSVRLWSAGSLMHQGKRLQHQQKVMSLAVNRDGSMVISGDRSNEAILWDAVKGSPIGDPFKHHDEISAVAFDPLNKTLVTSSFDMNAELWTIQPRKPVLQLLRPTEDTARGTYSVSSIAYSSDGSKLALGFSNGQVRLWNTLNIKALPVEMRHDKYVSSLAFSHDSKKLLTTSHDQSAKLWDCDTGACLVTFSGHTDAIHTGAISPDDQFVLTSSEDNTARIWNSKDGQLIAKLPHDGTVLSTAFNHDGTLALTASVDNTARLWVTATGKSHGHPMEHLGPIRNAHFHPGRELIVTGSLDSTVRLWDVVTTKAVGPAFRHPEKVTLTSLSQDGTTVVTASGAAVWIWKLPSPQKFAYQNVTLWTQVISCVELDESGIAHPSSWRKWMEDHSKLMTATVHPLKSESNRTKDDPE